MRSLEAALWASHNAIDFRDAVLRAVNLADDADRPAPALDALSEKPCRGQLFESDPNLVRTVEIAHAPQIAPEDRMRAHLTYLALAFAAATSIGKADAQQLRVFVSPVEAPAPDTPTEADRQAASAAWQAADQSRKALEKTLKEQYGNKRDKWPAEAQERFADAEEARDRANADWMYRSQAEPIFKEWTGIIERALTASGRTGRKEHITRAATPDEAHLIVRLIGVRNPKTAVNRPADRCLMFLLDRGPQLSVEQFARIPRSYRPRVFQAKRLEGPSEGSPAWRFESCVVDPYFRAQEALANVVDDFAGAHLTLLTGSAGQ